MDDPWVLAVEQAAGRAAGAVPVPAGLLALARRVVAAGRRVEALPPCPARVLARAGALAEAAPAGAAGRLFALLFDSWAAAAPALRGRATTRFLRYGGAGGSIDVEVGEAERGELRLRGTVDADGEDLSLEVRSDGRRPERVPVRAGGLFEAAVTAPGRGVTLVLRAGRRVLGRTSRLPPTA